MMARFCSGVLIPLMAPQCGEQPSRKGRPHVCGFLCNRHTHTHNKPFFLDLVCTFQLRCQKALDRGGAGSLRNSCTKSYCTIILL